MKLNPVPEGDVRNNTITDEELLEFLVRFYRENGRIPVITDFSNNPEYPSCVTYRYRFGSWNNALTIVGLVPIKYEKTKSFIDYKNVMSTFEYIPYYENPDCPMYTKHIREYLESVLDIERLPYTGSEYKKKLVDFLMNWNGEKLKVKHAVSCLHGNNVDPFWEYLIGNNKNADAFLLTAFNNKEYLDLRHMWLIKSDQIFQTKRVMKSFRDRKTLRIRNSKYIIDYMNKFELKEKLEQLKIIMKAGVHMPNDDHKDATRLLLIKKQRHIFDIIGVKRSIRSIAEDAIERGLGPKEISVDNVVLKIKKRRLRIVEGERKGLLREECENDAYNLVIEKQKEIFDMTGNMRTIKDIIGAAIELGIEYVK